MVKSFVNGLIIALFCASTAAAATVTIAVTGQIAEQPDHITNAPQAFELSDVGLALGDAVTLEVTFDTDFEPGIPGAQGRVRFNHLPDSFSASIGGRAANLLGTPVSASHYVSLWPRSDTFQTIDMAWGLDRSLWNDLALTRVGLDFADLTNDMFVPSELVPSALAADNVAKAERETAYFIFTNPDFQSGVDHPSLANYLVWFDIDSYSMTTGDEPAPVPLPASLPLMAAALYVLFGRGRRTERYG